MVAEAERKKTMIMRKCSISKGVGKSKNGLPSFDKALIEAGVGNYNLVRLSSILPARHEWYPVEALPDNLEEGSLLPTAYSTITSDKVGETIVSAVAVGIPKDFRKVGVIMEYSDKNISEEEATAKLHGMIKEAFTIRGWELENIICTSISVKVEEPDTKYTTFACIAEW